MQTSDIGALCKATLQIYRRALRQAVKGLILNWIAIVLPIVYFAIFFAVGRVVLVLFGTSLVGGLMLGLLQALLIAHYLSYVASAVAGERQSLIESWQQTKLLFLPVIGALFALFVLNILASLAFQDPKLLWIRGALNVLVVIVFNPIPEVVYQRSGPTTAMFGESLEFVKDNTIEWFLPLIVIALPVILLQPQAFVHLVASSNIMTLPLVFLQSFSMVAISGSMSAFVLTLCIGLLLAFVLMVFRGALFEELSRSTRRKRIYQYKFGGVDS